MPLVEKNMKLKASIALNNYTWTIPVDESVSFVPYGIKSIYPNGGPITGGSKIYINGQGFIERDEKPRCRFGSGTNTAIVEAEIHSYKLMSCKVPNVVELPSTLELPLDVQF